MKKLIEYIKDNIACHQSVDEKLIINKNYKNIQYGLNEILSKIYNAIEERKGGIIYTEIRQDDVFVDVAEITSEFGYKLSEIENGIEATRLFKKCNKIYMLEIYKTNINEFVSKMFDEMNRTNIELKQLNIDDSDKFYIKYNETDEFIILVTGHYKYYYLFLGKK